MMMMSASEIEALIKSALPDAAVSAGKTWPAMVITARRHGYIRSNSGAMTRVKVASDDFHAALRGRMGAEELHAPGLADICAPLRANVGERRRCQTILCSTVSKSEITDNPVMLYMKGTAMFLQCGFSALGEVQMSRTSGCRSRPPTCWRTQRCARGSSISRNGRPFRSFMCGVSLWAVAIS